MEKRFFVDRAWVDGAWARDVLLAAGADGRWSEVRVGCPPAQRGDAQVLVGAALPGLVNGHSHAFQRALAGLTESSPPGQADTFWSWRDRMYQVALSITPAQLERIATQLYGELRANGYAHVCEFHYLHNDLDGRPYADPLEMSLALVRAAQQAGIGLTLLPTLYMRAGFGTAGLRPDQRRFASTPEGVLRIAEAVRSIGSATLTAGIALHSLRAVDEGALRECAQAARAAGMPVHIHVAEQQLEVDDCLRHHGRRPIEWLAEQATIGPDWNLVHATQATPEELQAAHDAGASIVLCPTTEANLGDGVFDVPTWLRLGGRWSIGSDSHVCRSWTEELRLLEYSQRLLRRERNVAARAAGGESTAGVLFAAAVRGGEAAAGLPVRGLRVGGRASLQLLPDAGEASLDTAVFSTPGPAPSIVL